MKNQIQSYGWIITKDFLATPESGPEGTFSNSVGVVGPRGCKYDTEQIKKNGVRFQMRDDDGELYYEGYGLYCSDEEPLRDFGQPNAGCTRIEWFKEERKLKIAELFLILLIFVSACGKEQPPSVETPKAPEVTVVTPPEENGGDQTTTDPTEEPKEEPTEPDEEDDSEEPEEPYVAPPLTCTSPTQSTVTCTGGDLIGVVNMNLTAMFGSMLTGYCTNPTSGTGTCFFTSAQAILLTSGVNAGKWRINVTLSRQYPHYSQTLGAVGTPTQTGLLQ